jgi:hypothetical protein
MQGAKVEPDVYLLVDHFNGHRTLEKFLSLADATQAAEQRAIEPGCYLTVWKLTPGGTVGAHVTDVYPKQG